MYWLRGKFLISEHATTPNHNSTNGCNRSKSFSFFFFTITLHNLLQMHTFTHVTAILTMINNISWGLTLLVETQLWARMAFCAHRGRLIYQNSSGNAVSTFLCCALLTCLQTTLTWLNSWTGRGANRAVVAHSNMRAYNYILVMCEDQFAYRFRCFSEVMERY